MSQAVIGDAGAGKTDCIATLPLEALRGFLTPLNHPESQKPEETLNPTPLNPKTLNPKPSDPVFAWITEPFPFAGPELGREALHLEPPVEGLGFRVSGFGFRVSETLGQSQRWNTRTHKSQTPNPQSLPKPRTTPSSS